jgi:hypothetical protein
VFVYVRGASITDLDQQLLAAMYVYIYVCNVLYTYDCRLTVMSGRQIQTNQTAVRCVTVTFETVTYNAVTFRT